MVRVRWLHMFEKGINNRAQAGWISFSGNAARMPKLDNVQCLQHIQRLIDMVKVGQAHIVSAQIQPARQHQQQRQAQPPPLRPREELNLTRVFRHCVATQ